VEAPVADQQTEGPAAEEAAEVPPSQPTTHQEGGAQ